MDDTPADKPTTRPRRRTHRRDSVAKKCDHVRALALVALDLWLCYYGAGPSQVIDHMLRTLGGDQGDEKLIEAISQAARRWAKRRGSYKDSDADIIVRIARRDAGK